MSAMQARPPHPEVVAIAFRSFFKSKVELREPAEDIQVQHAHKSLVYLLENPREDGGRYLSSSTLVSAMTCLLWFPKGKGRSHLDLARLVHEQLQPFTLHKSTELRNKDFSRWICMLCRAGETREARKLLEDTSAETWRCPKAIQTDWIEVLRGFWSEENDEEFLSTLSILRERSLSFCPEMQALLVEYFTAKNDLEQAKNWYSQLGHSSDGDFHVHSWMLEFCAKNGDINYGQKIIASLLVANPAKDIWDIIFKWSAMTGKGVDEIERMMQVMVRRNEQDGIEDRPDATTINRLVEYAMSKNDPYTAERYISLGQKWGIQPNAKTYIMQMKYRLSVNDIDGARAAYIGLQGEQVQEEEDVYIINKLIQAMCKAGRYDFDAIMGVADDLGERKARFEPDTVSALCILHLRRDEFPDVIDLLRTHSYHYSSEQRATIRDVFVNFCLDRQNSTALVWDAYQIFRNVFDETPRDIRTRIMNEFFSRERSDMACHVFFHMRQNNDPQICATSDTYVAAFMGFARASDADSLELVHNQMKLDMDIEPNTRLLNSLMLAYTMTGDPRRGMEFWAEIVASKEGPSYSSIVIAFRACEKMPFGDRHAKPIWERLQKMDVEIDRDVFAAYVGALAGNSLHDEAEKLVLSAEEDFSITPDLLILGTLFNATINLNKQTRIENFIKKHYPAIWPELEALGVHITHDGFGYRQYHLNRDVEP